MQDRRRTTRRCWKGVHTAYLEDRRYYSYERRWPLAEFWSRRSLVAAAR
jgi:hypothetical protein